jgi:TorA maturation chaperone TorD
MGILLEVIEGQDYQLESLSVKDWAALAAWRSGVYGFLGAVYSRVPDNQLVEKLLNPDLINFLGSLEHTENLSEEMREGLRLIEDFIQASQGKPMDELRMELTVERTRLFRGLKPNYSPPPPYESVYLSSDQLPLIEATTAVARAYSEMDVFLPEEVRDQPDFIGFELDFMRHLTDREAQAWSHGNKELALKVLEKEQEFLEGHLIRWIPSCCDVLLKWTKLHYYMGFIKMTKGFVMDEARRARELLRWAGSFAATHERGGQRNG